MHRARRGPFLAPKRRIEQQQRRHEHHKQHGCHQHFSEQRPNRHGREQCQQWGFYELHFDDRLALGDVRGPLRTVRWAELDGRDVLHERNMLLRQPVLRPMPIAFAPATPAPNEVAGS